VHFVSAPAGTIKRKPSATFTKAKASGLNQSPVATAAWSNEFSRMISSASILTASCYDKAKMIADTRDASKYFVSNHLNEVKVRFYGDTAIAQGNESWQRRTGERGRFVWTDTWLRRNGRWQIIAAEDLTVPEESR